MRLREHAKLALLLAIGGSVALLGAEAMARAYAHLGGEVGQRLARHDPLAVLFVPHGTYGYRQKPNGTQHYWNGTSAHWNADAYRGPRVQRPKPAGTFRVVLLGGSTTHGFGADDDQTIDAHLREELRRRHPGRAIEVVNLALGGYDSYQVYERMRGDGVSFEPDVVIVNSGVNDVRNARFADLKNPDPRTLIWAGHMERLREEARRGGPSLWSRVKHHSYAARLPGFLRSNLERRDELSERTRIEPQPDALDYFETNLRRTAEIVSGAGAALILSTPPSSLETRYQPEDEDDVDYWLDDAAATAAYRVQLAQRMQRVAAERSAAGAPVPYLSHELPPEWFLDDCHLTSDGNRAVAHAFADALEPFLAARAAR